MLLIALGLLLCAPPAIAQLVIPSDGSDGAFAPDGSVTNLVIDLSLATDGVWSQDNSANAGNGVYDPDKWAVVFKYSSVNIPAGVTVSFKNHRSRAPVVWLVQGDVNISGVVDLAGKKGVIGVESLIPTEPGPGGFRGGAGGPQGAGAGLGPGSHGMGQYQSLYGNPQILPLIGGSGSPAPGGDQSGNSGGGAILIASSSSVTIVGSILANDRYSGRGGAASGGAVRIVASQVLGNGEINCLQDGRVRIEANALAASVRTYPETIAVPPASPPIIWPPEVAPTIRIVMIAEATVPVDPTAPLVSSADIAIQKDTPAVIILETLNFPIEGVVQVRAAQKWGGYQWVNATYASGNQAQALWRATNTFVKGYTTLQARATAP